MDYWMLIPLAVILIISIITLVVKHEKKRLELLKAQAMRLGFSYTAKAGLTEIQSAKEFHLFNIGHSRRVKSLMERSSDGVKTAIYDYQYTTGGGQNSHTAIQTVFQFQSERLRLPAFILRPENVFHKIGQSFGYQDIDFEAFPEFSKHYLLRGKDEPMIRKLFNQEVITRFESEKGIIIEAGGQILICYRSCKRVKPEDLFIMYEKMREFFNLFVRRCDYL
ncbi:hypothetical protein HQ585_13410 [candidate division KSB1 bacterium]|nr:hypothetical protein [candidate division KSB1 bacterium]